MKQYNIAVIRGDGIGGEVIEEGIKVMDTLSSKHNYNLNYTEFPWGSDWYFKNGTMMPDDAIVQLSSYDAIYLGAVGHPELQDHVTLNGLLLPIRRAFDQYVCLRPSILYPGISSPLSGYKSGDINLVVIRENTEGEYANAGGFQYLDFPTELGVQTAIFTRHGCERVIKYAFDLAVKRAGPKRVTSITKSNAQGYGMVVWDRAFERIATQYPEIETESLLIDAACMEFIRRPDSFDVVVGSNLFGDILTDIGGMITGSIGLSGSANIDPERRFPSMFEPVHGSAPDIAGKGISNPIAAILSGAMMLKHLGQEKASAEIEAAVIQVLETGGVLTADLGGKANTEKMGNTIVGELNQDRYSR